MKSKKFTLLLAAPVLWQCNTGETIEKPPLAEIRPVDEVIFGKKISDPYRYMENMEDTAVIAWFRQQADYARTILNRIPGRDGLIEKMKEFDSRKSARVYMVRITENDQYFYLKESPDDETGKLFYRNGFDGTEELLLDPENYRDDTLEYTINRTYPSIDGSNIAIEISPNGSENGELVIMKVSDKSYYPEKIDRIWGAAASWLPDGERFFYKRLNSPDIYDPNRLKNNKVYIHSLGKEPTADREVFSKQLCPGLDIDEGEIPIVYFDKDAGLIYAFLQSTDPRYKTYYAPWREIENEKINWKVLFTLEDNVYNFNTTATDLYIYTPEGAPNFKILKTTFEKLDFKNAEVVVPEDTNAVLEDFLLTKDGLYYTKTIHGVKEELYFKPYGEEHAEKLELPVASGTIYLNSKSLSSSDVWVILAGWTTDYYRYRYLPAKDEFVMENLSSMAEYPEYDDLVVEELMIPSHDGFKVPLSLIYRQGLKKEGNNPVLLYGYGSYGYSMNPFFSPSFLLWVYHGGILAVSHVRGGGELGDEWHKEGRKENKPNTWKDFIASAEYLIKNNYTSPQHIAMNSGSAGGILVGRAMTERPELFGCAIPEVGWMNPTRVENDPLGGVDIPEFGDVTDSLGFLARYEMDSYLHIENGVEYPATLVTAGMNDPRVIAWQPGKFAARLEAANTSDNPVLFWVDFAQGHGVGSTKTKYFEGLADVISFGLWQTGHPDFRVK